MLKQSRRNLQKFFIDSIFKQLDMENAYGALTPLDDEIKLNLPEPNEGEANEGKVDLKASVFRDRIVTGFLNPKSITTAPTSNAGRHLYIYDHQT
jgi:hypothetical protein